MIGGRYRALETIARGGMGEIARVLDTVENRVVALKRLRDADRTLISMLEREYHVLKSLEHPRIIEVYDYGLDEGKPWYTMELLDGSDLRELSPLGYRDVCLYLRDIASSLALLHARRLVHRDVSPRNIRVTKSGICKLIDFGALATAGFSGDVVGTPPCVPPEALRGSALDEGADLFGLGATAYYALTGVHAYNAKRLAELVDVWAQPPPRAPSLVAGARAALEGNAPPIIPRALDELVMALISLNPMARPASAMEVIEQLTTIGELEPIEAPSFRTAFLRRVALVGRHVELERFSRRIERTLASAGSSVFLDASPGAGSTRLLEEMALEAQVRGLLPVALDASKKPEPYGSVLSLIDQLARAAPEDVAKAAERDAAMLARLSPTIAALVSAAPDATNFGQMTGELRRRQQDAATRWVLAFSRLRPMFLTIDEAHALDEASAAVFVGVTHGAREHSLLLAFARKMGAIDVAPTAIRGLRELSGTMRLRDLPPPAIRSLVQSLFGGAEYSTRLADRLYARTHGNPRSTIELAELLVQTGVVRFAGGGWVLPIDVSATDLPASHADVVKTKIDALPPLARAHLEALSVHHGALHVDKCVALGEAIGVATPHDTLGVLVGEGFLLQTSEGFRVAGIAASEDIAATIPEERRKTIHRVLAALVPVGKDASTATKLDAGWHLLHGGDELAGAKLLADAGIALCYETDELPAAVPALKAALAVFRKHRRPVAEELRVLAPLVNAGYFADWRLTNAHASELFRMIRALAGLDLVARLRPKIGKRLGTYVGLFCGVVRYLVTPSLGGFRGFKESITHLLSCITTSAGVATLCMDPARAEEYSRQAEELRVLGEDHAAGVASSVARSVAGVGRQRAAESMARLLPLVRRLEAEKPIAGLPERLRRAMLGGTMYALGVIQTWADGTIALDVALRLEGLDLHLYRMAANQVRANYHAARGEMPKSEQYRRIVEVQAIQAGVGWQAEIWLPGSLVAACWKIGDVVGLRRSMEQLDRLRRDIPSMKRPYESAMVAYHAARGDYARAIRSYEESSLAAMEPRSYLGWVMTMSAYGAALNGLKRFGDAEALMKRTLAALDPADHTFGFSVHCLHVQLAMALVGQGRFAEARRFLEQSITEHPAAGPLTHGNLHAAAARVAIGEEDDARARFHAEQAEAAFAITENPVLIRRAETLRRALTAGRQAAETMLDEAERERMDGATEVSDDTSIAESMLGRCVGIDERAALALQLFVSHSGAQNGWIFLYSSGVLSLSTPAAGGAPPTEATERIGRAIDRLLREDPAEAATVQAAAEGESVDTSEIATCLLWVPQRGETRVLGAVVLRKGAQFRAPRQSLIHAIARGLHGEGDEAASIIA